MTNNYSVQDLTNRHTKPLTELSPGGTRRGIRLRTLLSFVFAALGLVITLASLLIFRSQVERQLLEGLGQRLYDVVAITATQQDGDALYNAERRPRYLFCS
jgi:uncharacterized membrane protein